MKWDLSDLYQSITDPKIKKDKKLIENLANKFTKNFKNKLNSSQVIEKAIKDYEYLLERSYWLGSYASFLHSLDTKSPEIGKFYQEINEFSTKIQAELVWFKLELAKSDIKAKNYEYFLKKLRAKKEFLLSEAEENILTKKSQTSTNAFHRFYDEKDSQLSFELKIGKKLKKLTGSQIIKIMSKDPSRALRQKAAMEISRVYSENSQFYTFILNTLLLDKKIEDEMRGYKYPAHSTFLSYDVDNYIVAAMVDVVSKNYSISEQFYESKSKLLNQKLFEWDRYSSVYDLAEKYSWVEAKDIILEAFSNFDKEFGQIAELFFDKNWIDAKITKNRQSGAYCSYLTPSKHPYVFMNFSGTMNDISTLAHELGHAIHAYLSRGQSMMNFFPSTATAEIASVFAESIVFDYLYNRLNDKKQKINLLSEKIQGSFATVFRQTAFHLFEEDIHARRRSSGELTSDEFGEYYQKRLQPMFGKGLTLTDNHKSFWMPILHFYHYNFYVFTYAFGELLTLSLYNLAKTDSNFVSKYKELLRQGGSKSPKDLLLSIGQDISDKNFWQKGLNLLQNYVIDFEEMVK